MLAVAAIASGIVAATAMAAAPSPVADYRFHDNLSSSVPGPPPIANVGTGNNFATENVAGCQSRVLTFPQDNGLVADTSSVLPGGDKLVVLDFRLANVDGYRRLIGISDVTSDNGLYVNDGKLDWFDGSDNEGTTTIAPNQWVEVELLQLPILSQFTEVGFVNGVEQFSPTGPDEIGNSPRLFKDNDPPASDDEESAGAVARVSFYQATGTPEAQAVYAASVFANPSLCPAASTAVKGKPRAVNSAYGGVVVDTGITAACPDYGVLCSGSISVTGSGAKKSKRTVLASGTLDLSSGISQSATVVLSKRGKKQLRKRGKLKVTATVSLTGPNGQPATATTSGKIKQPGSKKKR